jgi:hypothetical protein
MGGEGALNTFPSRSFKEGEMRFIDLTGRKFGRLTVQWPAGRGTVGNRTSGKKFPQIHWLCLCECGNTPVISVANLTGRNSYSCGCWNRELAAKRLTTHGMTGSAEQSMWQMAKIRAKRKGLPFDLKIEDIVIPERCPMLEIPIARGSGKLNDNSPTLDRREGSKGYVKGNIRVISYKANRAKNNLTFEEMKLMVKNWNCESGE